jgi:hypothetical protein
MNTFSTPILFLIYNRPDTTKLVFEEIRKQKPQNLYIAADGAKENKTGEEELCDLTREIITQIDWDCNIRTLFRQKNLGSKYAVSSAITWLFEHEEQGIILEDDCIPNDSFFFFCQELLIKYKHDSKIMHITGSNLNDTFKFGDGSYYYSQYANVWGWATWKRAWNKFDLEINDKETYLELINHTFKHISERVFWRSRIELIKSNQVDAWDYQWMFSIWREKGICLNSNYNLVTNIGFGKDATHTTGGSPYLNPYTKNLTEITHPSKQKIIKKAETEFIRSLHGLKRKGFFEYYLNRYFFQRCQNLLHKIKLKINKTGI